MDPEAQKGIPGGLYVAELISRPRELGVCPVVGSLRGLSTNDFTVVIFCLVSTVCMIIWQITKEAKELQGDREDDNDKKVVAEIMARCFIPTLVTATSWEEFHFVGHQIRITEAMDCYGAVVWPSALVLCYFLETNVKQYNMNDKNVIEIGAGTGLVSIVASLLGAHVTATDLPELLGNLQYNISRNTKMKCKHLPQVKELSWGIALDKNFPRSSNNFDYVLAADVVYAHPFLEELLITFDHLCKETTIILWVMKFRLEKENTFVDRFKELFDLEEISSFPSLNIKLYKAMKKSRRSA